MRSAKKCVIAVIGIGMLAGCVVREEPPRRRVYVYDAPPPGPVVVQEAPPADIVEVVPVAPGPEFIYIRGGWHREGGRWIWHHGYWNHR